MSARLGQLTVLALVAAVAVLSTLVNTATPDPLPADAADTDFSAVRAQQHVTEIAQRPHPAGTEAHRQVADYLVDQLTALGLAPEVTEAVGAAGDYDGVVLAGVRNISATLPGSSPAGRILIVSHYDSADVSHGAADDGIGLATMLEVARALLAGEPPRNDVEFLFTDAEENGLMGARAHVESERAGDPDRTVILNLEARGTSGPVYMFQTGAGSSALVPALRDQLPIADSVSDEVYQRLPNDTDFSVFKDAGFTGMNFAVVGGSANYHTPQDNVANLSLDSLQHMGGTALAASRQLADRDLAEVTDSSESTYFMVVGRLARYPMVLVLPLVLLTVLGYAAALRSAVRRGAVQPRRVGFTLATLVALLVVTFALGVAGWLVLRAVRPDYTGLLIGSPYRAALTATGLGAVGAVLTWIWAAVLGRKRTPVEVAAGVAGWFTLLAVLLAVLAPGGAYLFTWPALVGSIGVALAARTADDSALHPVLAGLGAFPAAVLLAPVTVSMFGTVGLAAAGVPLLLLAFVLAPAVPLVTDLARGRTAVVVTALVTVVGVVLAGAGVAVDRTDRAHPSQVSLFYALDADRGEASWVSSGAGDHFWVDRHVGADLADLEPAFPNLVSDAGWLTGPAPAATVPLPTLRVDGDQRDGGTRSVRLHLGAEDGTPTRLLLYVDTSTTTVASIDVADADGLPTAEELAEQGVRTEATGDWGWGLSYVAPPPDGVDLTLRVRGDGPLRLRVVAHSPELPADALDRPRPDTVTWSALWGGITVAARSFEV